MWFGLIYGLGAAVVTGLITVLVAGFPTSQLDDRLRLTPNQGIWRSRRNGLVVGLLVGLSSGLLAGGFFGLGAWLQVGLFVGLIAMLGFGLGAFFQHFALRFWLWRTGSLPWDYPRFLDYAADRILLRKVGGGYIFIHRLLLDYFASLETLSSEETSAVSASLQKANEKG
jgi:hypothetical protein